jgi:ADP-ribose pyrophosphatase YjhB (NUDIX family)
MEPKWLEWAQRIQAISQIGLTYAKDPFDLERYAALRDLAMEIVAHQSDTDMMHITDLFAEQQGYATPKVDVRGVVFHEGGLLLVKERQDGGWTLPGGWADVSDSPTQAVEKEIREESGYEARAIKLLAVYDRIKQGHPAQFFNVYKLFIRCELTGGAAAESIETDGVGFFPGTRVPAALAQPRPTPPDYAHVRTLPPSGVAQRIWIDLCVTIKIVDRQ